MDAVVRTKSSFLESCLESGALSTQVCEQVRVVDPMEIIIRKVIRAFFAVQAQLSFDSIIYLLGKRQTLSFVSLGYKFGCAENHILGVLFSLIHYRLLLLNLGGLPRTLQSFQRF